MRIPLHAVLPLALLACILPAGRARTQEIVASPVAKQPPAMIPGGGIQVDVHNRTLQPQRLRVREPGGNWYVFTFAPNGGLNLRCATCTNYFEATLPTDAQALVPLMPGTEYEIWRGDGRGRLLLRPRGAAGTPR